MTQYNCVIIDDDPAAISGLTKYIELLPNLLLLRAYTDPLLALLELESATNIDLVFMDVDMPHLTGIELARALHGKTCKLIMTTAYTQYGYEAFEVSADAYLLKPYSFNKFATTVAKLFTAQSVESNAYFFVKDKEKDNQLVKIFYKDIIAVESKQNYVMIYSAGQQVLTYMSLTAIAAILKEFPSFVKYHRSFIINREFISAIAGNTLKMMNGLQITIGESYRSEFAHYLEGKLLKAGHRG